MEERPRANRKMLAAMLIAGLLLPGIASAEEEEVSAGARWKHYSLVGLDAVFVRPAGCVVVVVGAAFLVPVAFFTWVFRGNVDAAVEVLVTIPAQEVVKRPLGRF